MSLPYPSMTFSPFAILTAEEMNELVANDQALAAGTGLNTSAVTTAKIADNNVTAAKLATNAITLGYAQITSSFSTSSTSATDVTGLSVTVTVPSGGRRIKITSWFGSVTAPGGGNATNVLLVEGATTLAASRANNPAGATTALTPPMASFVPSSGSHTYKVQMQNDVATSASLGASATSPAFILVEMI